MLLRRLFVRYSFGIDPAWHISSNELLFFNSMKMKMSVIIGIAQMTVGICLKGLNAYYFGEQLDFLFEFLPMIVFDACFFGYGFAHFCNGILTGTNACTGLLVTKTMRIGRSVLRLTLITQRLNYVR